MASKILVPSSNSASKDVTPGFLLVELTQGMTRVHQRNTTYEGFYTKFSSKEAQGLQEVGIAKLAIRVTLLIQGLQIKMQ
ncbi:hypothetical protein Tco_0798562 [Tanacetum coccineum]